MIRFETFDRLTLFGRRWFFRIVRNGNNETLAQSEAYNRSASRDIAIGIIQESVGRATVRSVKR